MSKENFRRDSHWIKGEVHDVIIDRAGNRTVLPTDYNLVVDSCSNLIACLMKDSSVTGDVSTGIGDTLFESAGIRYWGIGGIATDEEGVDAAIFTDPEAGDTSLKREFYRVPVVSDNIKFVDADGNEVADGEVTNRIKITITVPYDEGNGVWYEFGLFGGNSANENFNSGIMINRKKHDPINKSVNIQIQRTVIFTF